MGLFRFTLSHTADVFLRAIELLDEVGQVTFNLGMNLLIQRVNDTREQIDAGASPKSYYPDGLTQR